MDLLKILLAIWLFFGFVNVYMLSYYVKTSGDPMAQNKFFVRSTMILSFVLGPVLPMLGLGAAIRERDGE